VRDHILTFGLVQNAMDSNTKFLGNKKRDSYNQHLLRSFQYWTGNSLVNIEGSAEKQAQALFEAPFVLISHGTEDDPILNR